MNSFNFKESTVYKKAFALAMKIFEISKSFPKEEKYLLTGQAKPKSKNVCANPAKSHRNKKYPAHFISKHTDGDAEISETNVWTDFALAFNYIMNKFPLF